MKAWMWFLLLALIAQNTADMLILRAYTEAGKSHETFPILSYTLRYWGMDGSIWTIRAIVYSFVFGVLVLVRAAPCLLPYVCDFLVALNLVYAAGLTDVPFAFHWWGL